MVESTPYGTRFQFLKEIISVDPPPHPRLQATHNSQVGYGIEEDHFIPRKIYPGIFILEGCAQAAVALYHHHVSELKENEVPLLAHARVHFVNPIENSQDLVHSVELVKAVADAAVFSGKSTKGDLLVMECELALAVKSTKHIFRFP